MSEIKTPCDLFGKGYHDFIECECMSEEIEINIVGWFAVMLGKDCIAIFPTEEKAKWFASIRGVLDKTGKLNYEVLPITRKIDFPPTPLAETNPKSFRRGLV